MSWVSDQIDEHKKRTENTPFGHNSPLSAIPLSQTQDLQGQNLISSRPGDALAERFSNSQYWTGNPFDTTRAGINADKKRQAEEDEKNAAEDQSEADQARVMATRDQLNEQVNKFEANKNQNLKKQSGLISQDVRNGLIGSERTLKQDVNRRGLLGSGIEQKGHSDIQANAASDYAGRTANLGQDYDKQVNQMRESVADIGLKAGQMSQDQSSAYYQQAVRNMQDSNQAYGQAGAAIGTGVGTALGNRNKNKYYDNSTT